MYAGQSNAQIIDNLYLNLFGRNAEPAGLTYWAAQLTAGTQTFAQIALQLTYSAQGTDATAIANKLAAATSFTSALDTTAEIVGYDGTAAAASARTWLATVTDVESTLTAATASVDSAVSSAVVAGSSSSGQPFTLTSSVDSGTAFTGGSGNDTFTANYDPEVAAGAGGHTLGVLDVLDGGAGTDTLNITNDTGAYTLAAATISNIENITIQGAAGVTADVSGSNVTGLESISVTKSTTAAVTAATTTDVTVSGATGAVTVDGGKGVSVTAAAAGQDITIGATTVNAGTINVTSTKMGDQSIAVDGGTDVTVSATGSSGGVDTIKVGNGGASTDLPSGTVTVTSAHTATAATDVTLNAITAKGGSTVTVTQSSDTSKAATDTTGATLTQGAVTVVGGNSTTSVTVTQAASKAEVVGVTAVTGVTETASVKFSAITTGQTVILGGLTLTAAADMTAAEVASAFASLTKGFVPTVGTTSGDTQGSAAATKGVFTGYLTGWTSGAASTDTVVFTSTTASSNVGDLANSGTGTATVTTTAGSAATKAVTGVLGVKTGDVTIDDNATASITTVALDGYGTTLIGNTTSLTKLTDVSLANSGSSATAGNTDAAVTVDATGVASLNLAVNNVNGNVSLDGAADSALKTLNLDVTGTKSSFALTAAAVETLNITGDTSATLSTGTFTALKTITVTETAGATFDGDEADTLTSVNTSGTTGSVTATIDGTKATYTGGAGVDTVTLATGTALTKAIDLGAGNDTLSFAALNVTGSTATLSGGDGSDTLSMAAATAAALDGSVQSFYTGFEYLTINDAGAGQTIDLANLGFTTRVTTTTDGTITFDKLASNGTLEITATANTAHTVQIKDASTGTADVLNVELNAAASQTGGTLTAANVETINISSTDTETGATPTANTNTLTLVATKATAINVSGGNHLNLTTTGNTAVTSIDGSAMTGNLTVQAAGNVATTITGGSGADVLSASGGSGGGTAQVSTLTFTDGAANAAMVAGDSISVTIGSSTVTQVFDTNFATTLNALAAKIQDIDADSTVYTTGDTAVAGVITITAAVPGVAFTADATFTSGGTSAMTDVYADGAVSEVFDVDTITLGDNNGSTGVMDTGDSFSFDVTDAAGNVTTVTQAFDTNFATTVAAATAQIVAAGYTATDNGTVITVTGKAGKGEFVIDNYSFTDAGAASDVSGTPAQGGVDYIFDADTLTVAETTALTAGDTIKVSVTNGVSTYTTGDIAFNTNFATTMGDVATAVAALNGGNSFTAAFGGGVLTVTDKVTGGSPITNIDSTLTNQTTSVTDAFATTTANVTAMGDTLIGGAGADTLNSGAALGTMTGGDGQDLFVVASASTNVNAYTTITDFTSEDLLKFGSAVGFKSAAVTLGSTAVFQDYANAAINALALNEVGWFAFGGDTYVLMDAGTNGTSFANGTDFIVKLTGTIDLTNASFNNTYDTIAL